MSGIYKVPFNYTGTGPLDLVELNPSASQPLLLLGFTIFQTSDFGDAAEEGQELTLETGNSTSGSGGASATPVSTYTDGGAAGFTAEMGNTTPASGGTNVERGRWGWNVRMEKEKMHTEAEQIKIAAGVRGVFRLKGTSADSLTIRGELIIQEV